MNAPYTAYVKVLFDRTNEGDYEERVYSVDCQKEDLAFIAMLPFGEAGQSGIDDILKVYIWPTGHLPPIPPNEHFESLDALLDFFGSISFSKPSPNKE